MPFNVPHVDRKEIIKTIKKHLLNTVILRMDFADIFDAKDLASKLVAQFAKDFPQRDEETEELLGQTEFAIVPVKKITSYIMKNTSAQNYIKVNQNSILLEYKTYETFEKLMDVFNKVLAIYSTVYAENKILRVGLRKINFFDKEENNSMEKFAGYFNELLMPSMNNKCFDISLSQDMHGYIIKGENGEKYNLNFKYGTVKLEKIRRFILDIDGYSLKELTKENLVKRLEEINNKIFDIFYWSITERMKGVLSQ
jgi:uncharacterized protein (TIGR04255 family)